MDLPELAEPPSSGITAWMQDDGFYARLYPVPHITWRPLAEIAALYAVIGLGTAALMAAGYATDLLAHPNWLGFGLIFVLMVYAARHATGFFPVEVAVDGPNLVLDSERIPLRSVASARIDALGRVVFLGDGDRELGAVADLPPAVATWLTQAVATFIEWEYAKDLAERPRAD